MRTCQQKQVLLMRVLACASHLVCSYPIARIKRGPQQGSLVSVGATWLWLVVKGSHREDWLEQRAEGRTRQPSSERTGESRNTHGLSFSICSVGDQLPTPICPQH